MFSMILPQTLSQNFLQNQRGISLTRIGTLISIRSVGIVLLNLALGQFNAGLGFVISQLAMGFSALLLWQGKGLTGYSLGYLLMGSQQTARTLAIAQGRKLIQAANMGISYGLLETVSAFANILAPLTAGFLYSIHPTYIYSTSLILIPASMLLTIFFSPARSNNLTPNELEV
jgi:hypothetical protein